jgi:subfamily B ATP-binding cassette protein MsbA
MTPPASPVSQVLRHCWRVAAVRWWELAVPLALVLAATALEGAAFLLLIPLMKAVGASAFGAAADWGLVAWLQRQVAAMGVPAARRDAVQVLLLVGLIILGRMGKLALEYVRVRFLTARTERYRVAVHAEVFRRVLSFGRQYFARESLGVVDAEVQGANAPIGVLTAVEETVRFGIGLVMKIGVMLALSVPLSVAFALTLPALGFAMRTIDRRVARFAEAGVAAERRVRSRILDILGSIPLVKVNSQELEAAAGYVAALREHERENVRRERVTSLRYPLEETTILLVMLAVQGSVMLMSPTFSPGDLATFGAFLLIVQQALPDYKWLGWLRTRLAEERPRLQALARLYTDEGKYVVPSGTRPFAGVEREIELEGVSFAYEGGRPVLHDIRARIAAGTVTAIVGASGAGKTTLVDLLVRLYDCPPGTIRLDGVDIREFAIPSLHARMAMVSQDVWLLNRSLRDNLTFGVARAPDDAALWQALDDVDLRSLFEARPEGLDTELGDRGVRLSGGQRQRVALARAMLRDPEILILDEATSALDSVVEQRVARAIQRRAAGRTLLMIAHRLSTIRDADQILVLAGGRLVEHGTWEALLARGGEFRRLHDAQVDGE